MKNLTTFILASLLSAGGVFALPLAQLSALEGDANSLLNPTSLLQSFPTTESRSTSQGPENGPSSSSGGVESPSAGEGVDNGPSNSKGANGGAGGAGTGLLGIGGDGGDTFIFPDVCLGISVCDPIDGEGAQQAA